MFLLTLLLILLRSTVTFQTACKHVLNGCVSKSMQNWTSCYEKEIRTCVKGRMDSDPNFIHENVNTYQQVEKKLPQHTVSIPASALQSSRPRSQPSEKDVLLVITVLNSTYFRPKAPPRGTGPSVSNGFNNDTLGGSVLVVKLGQNSVRKLSQPILLDFKHNQPTVYGTCVFWNVEQTEEGYWSTEGCTTSASTDGFLCSCNHLSFFAVLVNPTVSLDRVTAVNLAYIGIVGSALSVICSPLSLIIYACLQRRRPDKSIGVHMQLTGAILCLHLSLLLGCLWAWLKGGGWPCTVFGALLHWSLLGSFTWTAIEGFHLYMLLVRVFNVYVRKYLLKLSLVGWGVPTAIVLTCGILDVYGKFTVSITDNASNTTLGMCWMKNTTTGGIQAINVLMLTFIGLVLLFNSAMLGLVLVKLRSVRSSSVGFGRGMKGNNDKWKLIDKEKSSRLCKDLATVLGLSCVLGLAWGFSYTTYSSVSAIGVYLFTILNSLQGVFMFLWSLALTCKSRSENNSSAQDTSTKKNMETSFNS